MVDSPVPTITFTILYLIIVYIGPRLMKHRAPFRLTSVLIPYNLAMALLSLYIAVEVSMVYHVYLSFLGFRIL